MLQVEYKFVVLSADGSHACAWQSGNNSVLAVQAGEDTVEVFDNWWGSALPLHMAHLRFLRKAKSSQPLAAEHSCRLQHSKSLHASDAQVRLRSSTCDA